MYKAYTKFMNRAHTAKKWRLGPKRFGHWGYEKSGKENGERPIILEVCK